MNTKKITQEDIWLELANLFFLDTEHDNRVFENVARMLVENGWTAEFTFDFIAKMIAPKYGNNIGFLIYPVIGTWAGFDREELIKEVNHQVALRKKYPDWYFIISDWLMKRLLIALDFTKLEKAMNICIGR